MKLIKKTRRLVLGDGDAIGHKHVLESRTDIEYTETDGSIRFLLKDPGVLSHDEHDRMVFGAGTLLRSYHQVEFNPMDNTVTRVFD